MGALRRCSQLGDAMIKVGSLFAQIVDDAERRSEFPHHPEGFEDGFFETYESDPDNGGYDDAEGW